MFTTKIGKPNASESWSGVGKPLASESYSKVGKPLASETWTKVKLETAPASNLADIAEADVVIVDDTNSIPNLSE